MSKKIKNNLVVFIFMISLVLLSACASPTEPNRSVTDQLLAPDSFEKNDPRSKALSMEVRIYLLKLHVLDKDLALEVGRLPEFCGDISIEHVKVLESFVQLISNASDEQIVRFKELIDEGIPEVRKYCVPLQAVIWMLEKGYDPEDPALFDWPLRGILMVGWDFSDHHWKTKSFEEVTDRLNSPELISIYARSNFRYASKLEDPHSAGDYMGLFERKKGWCKAYAEFHRYCLKKAGYEAKVIHVESPNNNPYHAVCEFKGRDGKLYVIEDTIPFVMDGVIEKKMYTDIYPQIYR